MKSTYYYIADEEVKSNYYNKYIRRLRLEIDDDGIMRIKVIEE